MVKRKKLQREIQITVLCHIKPCSLNIKKKLTLALDIIIMMSRHKMICNKKCDHILINQKPLNYLAGA